MTLMQISEPGESREPHRERHAIGIDLGTTNSLVATVRSGAATVLVDELGRPLLPSIVRYHPDGCVEVGYAAQAKQAPTSINGYSSTVENTWGATRALNMPPSTPPMESHT